MKQNNKKFKMNLKIRQFSYVIFIFIFIFAFIGAVSAVELEQTDITNEDTSLITESNDLFKGEKDVLSSTSVYNVDSSSTNDEIQSIFDNSNSGDTIVFTDNSYNNISIVVDKKLNLVSNRNSIIHTSTSVSKKAQEKGIDYSFGFYFTNLSSGSTLKGLTIIGNSDYGVVVEGVSNVNILNNTISGGKKAGIYLNNSKYINVNGNIVKNAYDGISLNNVNRSNLTNNRIYSNENDGLLMRNVVLNNITNNSIMKNGLDGIHLENAKVNNIFHNNVSGNNGSGLRLEGYTTRNKISYNNISSNIVNIYANSHTTEDTITRNTLMFARMGSFYDTADNTGAAIVFADNYSVSTGFNMLYSHNSVGFNDQWDAKSSMSHPPVDIGANWYFDNDGSYGLGHICPMVFGGVLDPEEFKHLSMGFGGDENGIFGQLFDGDTATGAGAFTIDNVNINGEDYGSVEVGSDGRFNLDLNKIPTGSNITITINGHSFTISIDSNISSNRTSNNSTEEEDSPIQVPDEPKQYKEPKKVPKAKAVSSSIIGNGTGSGSGSSRGSGSGEGNFTGSGISVGDVSGESNAGTGDSGENGGGSASEGVNAYEIFPQENTPTTAKNSQLLAVFGVALVLLIIALGYRSKNKNEYEDDGENYSL